MSSFTVGVEEEYQLVDARTGELQSRARSVLAADWTGELRNELQESTVEIGTRICGSAVEIERELRRLRFQTATAAASEGLQIVAAGVHPASRWQSHTPTEGERWARIADEYGRIARDEHNFGMHIHVALPDVTDAVRVLNTCRFYLPHLLALSCSSPMYEGEDTGMASWRMILWRRWPNSGAPPRFGSMAEYRAFVDLLLRAGAIGDERNLYWSVRLHPEYPTLEFRVMDVCPLIRDAAGITALARALVAAAVDGALPEDPWPGLSSDLAHAVLGANEWRAARHGLQAVLVDPGTQGARTPIRAAIEQLVELVLPVAEGLGDGDAVRGIAAILRDGNGADRIRRTYADCGRVQPLVSWLVGETMLGTGMDRRTAQRPRRERRESTGLPER